MPPMGAPLRVRQRRKGHLPPSITKNRAYLRLWGALVTSVTGDQILPIAVTVSVLNGGGDATTVGAVLAPKYAALLVFSLFGGVWADRLPRRRVMLGSQGFTCVVVATGLSGVTDPWALGAMVFCAGAAESFFRPAYHACLASVLPPEQRCVAAGLNTVSWRIGAITGPGLGALVVDAWSPRLGFLVAAVAFAANLPLLYRLPEPTVPPAPRAAVPREIAVGLLELWHRRWLGVVILVASLQLMLTVAPTQVILPLVARDRFGQDGVYGTALALLSVGGLLGGLLGMWWRPRRRGLVAMLGLTPHALTPLALLWPLAPWFVYLCYALAGVGIEIFAVQLIVAIQQEVPHDRMARVFSLEAMAASTLMPLGLALTGPVSARLGLPFVLIIAAAASSLPPVLALTVPGMIRFRTPEARRRAAQTVTVP